jgi:FAD/FMN-containing dehydrogenase
MFKSEKLRHRERRAAGFDATPAPASAIPSPKAVGEFVKKIEGTVVVPTDPNYHAARQVFSHEFQSMPQLIVYCEVFEDVRQCLEFATQNKLCAVARSGGHSTAGYSVNCDMVIDLSRMNYVTVNVAEKTAVVGAGATFGHVNATLNSYRLHMVGGGCDDVAIAGYMQGGGYGFTSREYGMGCDNMIDALVMLADGSIVTASKTVNQDLFWAIRGGTGNNFGILLQATFQLHNLWQVWGFGLLWPIEHAPAALVELQKNYMTSGATDKLGYMVIVTAQEGKNVMLMRGVFHGSRADGMVALASLLATEGVDLQVDLDDTTTYLEVNRYIVDAPFPIPDVPNGVNEDKQSAYISQPLSIKDWQRIMERFGQSPCAWSWFVIEPYGGKINSVAKGDNAFIHRDVLMNTFFGLFWRTPEEKGEFEDFLDEFMEMYAPLCNGHSYQNYPRRRQKNFAEAYWGDYYPCLVAIKRKYDPNGFFRYQQAVSLEDGQGGACPVQLPISKPIVREPWSEAAE